MSFNEYCARKLTAPTGGFPDLEDAAEAVSRAAALFGGDLIGVVAFGSWARGDSAAGSDVDLLLVVENTVELTRELYRRWDADPVRWGDRTVDAHFVHLPAREAPSTGMWGEVALDGIVLFERGLRLTQHLIRVRHDIAAGRIVRRMAHGQPSWTEVA